MVQEVEREKAINLKKNDKDRETRLERELYKNTGWLSTQNYSYQNRLRNKQ
jgi:hypothetical protein